MDDREWSQSRWAHFKADMARGLKTRWEAWQRAHPSWQKKRAKREGRAQSGTRLSHDEHHLPHSIGEVRFFFGA